MFRFGECELDAARRELRRGHDLIHLEPQAFDLLVYLLENRDRVVSKIELLDGVWGHRFISEANLTTRVKEVRRAVGDDGSRQHTVRNVHGRGYRLVAPVEIVDVRAPAWDRASGTLIGRDIELAALLDLLGRSPLVTLTGPGGVGKSTLARAVAAQMGRSHAHGGHVVELAAVDSGAHVLPAVARALDIVLDSDHRDGAVRSIAHLDALLVLDNCEHVIDEAAVLVGRLLTVSGTHLQIVATSQVRLGLSIEVVVPVGQLDVTDASELFARHVHTRSFHRGIVTRSVVIGSTSWCPVLTGFR